MEISEFENKIIQVAETLEKETRYSATRGFIQHGDTSVFVHCVCVAYMSCLIVKKLHVRVSIDSMIVGALLHDYFLYDWHDGKIERRIHGFTHPFAAFKNARADYALDRIEENIIKRHMFPLVPVPPLCREAWIVCLADKMCATEESLFGRCRGRKYEFAKQL